MSQSISGLQRGLIYFAAAQRLVGPSLAWFPALRGCRDTLCSTAHAVFVEIVFRNPLQRGKLILVRNLLTICSVGLAVYSSDSESWRYETAIHRLGSRRSRSRSDRRNRARSDGRLAGIAGLAFRGASCSVGA